MSTYPLNRAAQHGISLIETMCVLCVVSVAIGTAIPSLGSLSQKAELAGAAAQVETDVQFARSQAVALNRTVQFTLREANGATCYIVHTGPAASCSCSGQEPSASTCGDGSNLLRAVSFASQGIVQVRSASKSVTFILCGERSHQPPRCASKRATAGPSIKSSMCWGACAAAARRVRL
jgi:type IV fimbrial biogenesis protein FimT